MSTHIKRPEIAQTLTLANPVTLGTEQINELQFVKLKAKHLRGLPPLTVNADGKTEMSMDFLLALAVKLCNEHSAAVDELEGQDVFAVLDLVGDFFGGSPQIMKTPSGA